MCSTKNLKKCVVCGEQYPKTNEFFHYTDIKKGYYHRHCKKCRYEIRKKRREKNPEKYAIARKRRRDANIDKYRATENQYYHNNIERRRASVRKYRIKNIDKLRAANRQWSRENKKKRGIYNTQWCKDNPDKISVINKRRRSTPSGRLNHRMGTGIWQSLKGSKNGRAWEILIGYTRNDLKKHLEKQFVNGMSWENMGKWHIDHIVPVSAFNFTKAEHIDFRRCWSLKNLRPLWQHDNLIKNNKIKGHFQPSLLL